jgi:hypothetical protein
MDNTIIDPKHKVILEQYLELIAPAFAAPWNAEQSILKMHAENNPTLQTEWQGWFSEHLLEKDPSLQSNSIQVHSKIQPEANRILDAFYNTSDIKCPIDIKTTSGHKKVGDVITYSPGSIILNDKDTTDSVLETYGFTGLLIISGISVLEEPENRTVKQLLSRLKEERDGVAISSYAANNIRQGKKSRLLKKTFIPKRIEFYLWTEKEFRIHEREGNLTAKNQPGLNSNGKPRPQKYNMKVSKIEPTAFRNL